MTQAPIGDAPRLDGPVTLLDYSGQWPLQYQLEAERIRSALGERALLLEHVGSTSVPGLLAKPVIDICLAVADPADEQAYLPALEEAGYVLRFREPDWFEHRLLNGPDIAVNLHVFGAGAAEIDRMLRFRDRLRSDPDDRELYARTKRELAVRTWAYIQDYADAKSAVVAAIMTRAPASGPPEARRDVAGRPAAPSISAGRTRSGP
jgi:GrpB-like predicted nucleotidyltransferase (UPF0157 family)